METIPYLVFAKVSFVSLIISFNEASASSVNWFVEVTISAYGFLDVLMYEIKLAQYGLTLSTDKSSK